MVRQFAQLDARNVGDTLALTVCAALTDSRRSGSERIKAQSYPIRLGLFCELGHEPVNDREFSACSISA